MVLETGDHCAGKPWASTTQVPNDGTYTPCEVIRNDLLNEVVIRAFRTAIRTNESLFHGKVVLDVGCGTGILSMYAARAGAKKVIAIDWRDTVKLAQQVVIDNKMSEVITVLCGKVVDLELPGDIDQVDIIISQWMGYCLFYGGNLDNVLLARDKWLKPHGLIFPDRATLFITAITDQKFYDENFNYLDNIHRFNMSSMRSLALKIPQHDNVSPDSVVATNFLIRELDLYTVQKEDINFTSNFTLTITQQQFVHALLMYFTVDFSKSALPVRFSTSPIGDLMHLKPTLFYLSRRLVAKKGEALTGNISFTCNERTLEFKISIKFEGELCHIDQSNFYCIV